MLQMLLNPHLFQNQILSWQWFQQITVISESMSPFSTEGKGLNFGPLIDGLLVLVDGLRKGFFSALFITLVLNPPEDTESITDTS